MAAIIQFDDMLFIKRASYTFLCEVRIDKLIFMFWGPKFFPFRRYEINNNERNLTRIINMCAQKGSSEAHKY